MTMKEYLQRYRVINTSDEREEVEDQDLSPYNGIFDPRHTSTLNMDVTV